MGQFAWFLFVAAVFYGVLFSGVLGNNTLLVF